MPKIEVQEVLQKQGKKGAYLSLKTNEGWLNVFGDSMKVVSGPGAYDAEITTSKDGKFKNVSSIKAYTNGNGNGAGTATDYGRGAQAGNAVNGAVTLVASQVRAGTIPEGATVLSLVSEYAKHLFTLSSDLKAQTEADPTEEAVPF